MGCCHSQAPPTVEKTATSEFGSYLQDKKKDRHHGKDSNYTLSSVKAPAHNAAFSYETRVKTSPHSHDASADDSQLKETDPFPNTNKVPNNLNTQNTNANGEIIPSTSNSPKQMLPFDTRNNYDNNKLSPNNANTNDNNIIDNREREMSHSHSRPFKVRNEPQNTNKQSQNNDNKKMVYSSDDSDSDASSLSNDIEIPGLNTLIMDNNDDADDGDEDDDQMLYLIVQKENERLSEEIAKMKSYVEEHEKKVDHIKQKSQRRLAQPVPVIDDDDDNDNEDDEAIKKQKLRERFEKKQQRRLKAMEEKKEKRKKMKKQELLRKKMEQRQKDRIQKRNTIRIKRKQELEKFSNINERPDKKQIVKMFDKYFAKPFEIERAQRAVLSHRHKKRKGSQSSSSSSSSTTTTTTTSDDDDDEFEDIPENGVNFDGFMAGLKGLKLHKKITKAEIKMLWDHMTDYDNTNGINAIDLLFFLKQNSVTFEPKLAILQKKILSLLTEQQDKEDADEASQVKNGMKKEIEISDAPSTNNSKLNMKSKVPDYTADIVLPEDDDDFEVKISMEDYMQSQPKTLQRAETDGKTIVKNAAKRGSNHLNNNRDSMSVSMSMSHSGTQSMKTLPLNVPRQSFRKINYNWNDSMSNKAFNNYKRMKKKFAFRYSHSPRKTLNEELMLKHEQLFEEVIKDQDKKSDDDHDHDNAVNTETVEANIAQEMMSQQNDDNKDKEIEKQTTFKIEIDEVDLKEEMDDKYEMNDEMNDEETRAFEEMRGKRKRSAAESVKAVREYQGDNKLKELRALYKQQHKMKKKLQRLKKRSLLQFPAPPKPSNIEEFLNDKVRYLHNELHACICKNTRYTGLANFGPNGELGIEIEYTSDMDEKGRIKGQRITQFKGMKKSKGQGRVWTDLQWNGHKYVPCVRFQWIDEYEGITTKLQFDSISDELDVDHSFFQGRCYRYPSDLDPKARNTRLIMHEGFFDFVCVSARRRTIRRNSLLQYHTLDLNEMSEIELEKVPKYVRRMSAYTEKIDEMYEKQAIAQTKEQLFGQALQSVAAIQSSNSDHAIPEPISE